MNVEKHVFDFIDRFRLMTFAGNLIRIPSYLDEEEKKCDYLTKEMKAIGLETTEVIVGPSVNRRNVIGIRRGAALPDHPAIVCAAHIDTHWPQESQKDIAHTARVSEGKIYGVGAGDSMAPMASFLSAFDALERAGIRLKRSAGIIATVDELGAKSGAQILQNYGFTADMCLIGEQTDMEIGVVHTGKVEVEVVVEGQAPSLLQGHAERLGLKVGNAVTEMVHVINSLEHMVAVESFFHQKHPLLPGEGAAFYVGPIIGGNTGYGSPTRGPDIGSDRQGLAVPSPTWCKVRVGARYWPGQTSEEFVSLVKTWAERAIVDNPSIKVRINCYLDHGNVPVETNPNCRIVEILRSAINEVTGRQPKLIGSIYSTEGPFFQRMGTEVAWCAPGVMRVGSAREHVTIEELETYTKIYLAAILKACGKEG